MSEASKAGLIAAKAGGAASAAKRVEQSAKLERFRACLIERVGNPDPIQLALIDSCCSLYVCVLRRCNMTRGVNVKVNPLALSAAVTGLRGTLRALGLANGPSEPPELPAGAALEQWARERQARLAAERQSSAEGDNNEYH